jgi:hypothetical protein
MLATTLRPERRSPRSRRRLGRAGQHPAAACAMYGPLQLAPRRTEGHGDRLQRQVVRKEPTLSRWPPAVTATRRTAQANSLTRRSEVNGKLSSGEPLYAVHTVTCQTNCALVPGSIFSATKEKSLSPSAQRCQWRYKALFTGRASESHVQCLDVTRTSQYTARVYKGAQTGYMN